MSNVFKVKFESAFPATGRLQTEIIAWLSDSMVVKVDGEDSQVAVDMVRAYVLSKVNKACSADAPINTVKGFHLRGVEFITQIDLE